MKILKQPKGLDFEQPLLNKILRVHVALMHSARGNSSGYRSDTSVTYYDTRKTIQSLDYTNWRVKLIKKLGT